MRISLALVMALALAGGCKKKQESTKGSADPGSGASTGSTGSGVATGGAGDPTHTATTEGLGDLKPINECPPALSGTDKGLARTIPAGCTTVVEGEYYVDGTLTIEAGATLRFKPEAALYLAYSAPGRLEVRGTKDKPVTFTSAGDAVAGVWRGVHLYPRAPRSKISGLVIEHAHKGLEIEAPDVIVEDSTIRSIKDVGVTFTAAAPAGSFARNTLEKIEGRAMSVVPETMIGFGAGNTFAADAEVELRAGHAPVSGTWQNPGAPVHVTGEVYIEGKSGRTAIEVAAGVSFRFDRVGAIYVGYAGDGELHAKGTEAAPVSFGSAADKTAGAWENGIIAYSRGSISIEHAVFEHGGREKSGALRSESGKLSVTSTIFRDNVVGLSIDDGTELRAFDKNQFAKNTEAAAILFPRHLGALGGASTYASGQKIEVLGGRVEKAVTWAIQPAAELVVSGEIYIEGGGSVTIPAGATYAFTDGGAVYVGYSGDATLVVQGTKDKPVTLRGVRDDVGTWKGVELYAHARASVLEHVVLRNTGETGGVRISGGGATVKIDGLSCAKCAEAAVRWDCGSKVTQTGVKAEDGTPKAALAPEGC